ncbi:MAG: biopolymer transporter ExbD [Sphingobacteriia bacterium]|jgi:biopolymer transport protein ExbD|nr:biopolymer transporter ExbD [Sphingobacteriia bacterium]
MPKNKIARKSSKIDMTAMVDLAFLLLTFFMLATNFKAEEAAKVETPSSISDTVIPERDIMMITVNDSGKVFIGIDNKDSRAAMLKKVASANKITLTEEELHAFTLETNFGVPITQLKAWLALSPMERESFKQPGIPCDTVLNDLPQWIVQGRFGHKEVTSNDIRVVLKADKNTHYPAISNIIETFRELRVHNFALITTLEDDPRN